MNKWCFHAHWWTGAVSPDVETLTDCLELEIRACKDDNRTNPHTSRFISLFTGLSLDRQRLTQTQTHRAFVCFVQLKCWFDCQSFEWEIYYVERSTRLHQSISICLSLSLSRFSCGLNEISRVLSSFVAVFSLRSVRSALLPDYLFRPLSPRRQHCGRRHSRGTWTPRRPPRPLMPEHSCSNLWTTHTHTHTINTNISA